MAGRTRGEIGRTAGLSRGHYNRIENGVKVPTASSVERISQAFLFFGVRADTMWIIFGTGKGAHKLRKKRSEPDAPQRNSQPPAQG